MNEFDQPSRESFGIIPSHDVELATTFADKIVTRPDGHHAKSVYSWLNEAYLRGGFSLLTREAIDDSNENLIGVKVIPDETGKIVISKYYLLATEGRDGIFLVSPPEIYDDLVTAHQSLTETAEGEYMAERLMMDMGLYNPGENAWDEFMQLLEDGRTQKVHDDDHVRREAERLLSQTFNSPDLWYTDDIL